MTKELIKKAKKGDKSAFEQVILYYQNDLYKIAKTRLSENADIDDAIQETIISAYQSIHNLINISKIKSWLITILINKCNHIYKNKQNNTHVSYEDIEAEKYYSSSTTFDSNLEFENLMNILNNDEKTIFVLYYSEGYKTKEIAKILQMNESTVRNKILRGKRKIEINLKEGNNNG